MYEELELKFLIFFRWALSVVYDTNGTHVNTGLRLFQYSLKALFAGKLSAPLVQDQLHYVILLERKNECHGPTPKRKFIFVDV